VDVYRAAIAHLGVRPTLIEWDNEIPAVSVLLEEARHAQDVMDRAHDDVAA
jgi:hypothetical protein